MLLDMDSVTKLVEQVRHAETKEEAVEMVLLSTIRRREFSAQIFSAMIANPATQTRVAQYVQSGQMTETLALETQAMSSIKAATILLNCLRKAEILDEQREIQDARTSGDNVVSFNKEQN